MWRERTYFALQLLGHSPLLREVKAGTQIGTRRQEQKQIHGRIVLTSLLPMVSPVCLLFLSQDYLPGVAPRTVDWPLCYSLKKKW